MNAARNIPALTGVRILAAVAVYASHLDAPADTPDIIATTMTAGYAGVTLFFMLSGFVLSLSYFDALSQPTSKAIGRFAVNRLARIWPVYLFVLLMVVWRRLDTGGDIPSWSWTHPLGLQAWDPNVNAAFGLNSPGWSISVELFLYACFPLIVLALRRATVRQLVTLGIVTLGVLALVTWWFAANRTSIPSDPASAHRWLYRTPLSRLGDFTIGVIAARVFVLRPSLRRGGPVVAMVGFGAFVAVMANKDALLTAWSWDVLYVVPGFLIIWGLATSNSGPVHSVLSSRLMTKLGEISFVFYLIHLPLIREFDVALWPHGFTPRGIAVQVGYLTAILVVAYLIHVAVELPGRELVRRASMAHRPMSSTRMNAGEVADGAELTVPAEVASRPFLVTLPDTPVSSN